MWRRVSARLSYLVVDDTIITPNENVISGKGDFSTHVYNECDTIKKRTIPFVRARAFCFLLSKQPIIVLSLRKTTRNNRLVIAIAEFETRDRPERFLHLLPSTFRSRLLSSRLLFYLISFCLVLVVVLVPSRFLDIDSCTLVAVRDSMTRPLHTNLALSSMDIHCELVQGDQLQSLKIYNILI